MKGIKSNIGVVNSLKMLLLFWLFAFEIFTSLEASIAEFCSS